MSRTLFGLYFLRSWNIISRSTKSLYSSYQDSFQFWIMEKFRKENIYISHSKVCHSPEIVVKDCSKLSTNEILNWMIYIDNYNILVSNTKCSVEAELLKRIRKAYLNEVLEILDAAHSSYKSKFTESEIYKHGISRLLFLVKGGNINSHHITQCIHYASMSKNVTNSSKVLNEILNYFVDDVKTLTNEELGIICNALFRTSIKLPSKFIKIIVQRLKEEFDWFVENSIILTCFIKSLRLSQVFDSELFEIIVQKEDNLKSLSFIPKVHLIVYVSDVLYPNKAFVSSLVYSALNDMDELWKNKKKIRLKEIDNLLWAASNYDIEEFSHQIHRHCLISIIEKVVLKSKVEKETVFAILLSLWILKCRHSENLFDFVNKRNIVDVKRQGTFKDFEKINLLISCISIEASHLMCDEVLEERSFKSQPKMDKYLKKRPKLSKLLVILNNNNEFLNLQDIRFTFAVPCLYIAGVRAVFKDKPIFLELCDDTVCLRGSTETNGLMTLKLRLLRAMGSEVCVIRETLSDQSAGDVIDIVKKWTNSLLR